MNASACPCISSVLEEAEASKITKILMNKTRENNGDGKWGKKTPPSFSHLVTNLSASNCTTSWGWFRELPPDLIADCAVCGAPPPSGHTGSLQGCWWHLNCNVNNCTMRPFGAWRPAVWRRQSEWKSGSVSSFAAWTRSENATVWLSHILDALLISISHVYIHASTSVVVYSALQLSARRSACRSGRVLFIYLFFRWRQKESCKQSNYWTGQFKNSSDFNLLLVRLPSQFKPSLSEVWCWWTALLSRVFRSFQDANV